MDNVCAVKNNARCHGSREQMINVRRRDESAGMCADVAPAYETLSCAVKTIYNRYSMRQMQPSHFRFWPQRLYGKARFCGLELLRKTGPGRKMHGLMLLALTALMAGQLQAADTPWPARGSNDQPAVSFASAPIDLPAALSKMHPRLYGDAKRLEQIKALCQREQPYEDFWIRFEKQAGAIRMPPSKLEWDRAPGDKLWDLTAAWRLSGNPAYLKKAKAWAMAIKDCPDSYFEGFFSGHLLCGMALFYDWCYEELEPELRETVREFLVRGSGKTKEYLDSSKKRELLSNQWQIRVASIGVCALALDDHPGKSSDWVDWALRQMAEMEKAAADDGVTVEGIGYGQYGLEFTMRFDDLARQLLGINFYRNPWWSNNGLFQLYQTTPRGAWESAARFANRPDTGWMNVDIGDCPRYNWYGPDHLLRGIAKETGNPYAQWLAEALNGGRHQAGESWLNLFRYDPNVKSQAPTNLPTIHHFENTGIVSARSDWSGQESLISFICGPYYGHRAVDTCEFDTGSGHAHPNANAFGIFGGGEWLVSYPGYVRRMAEYENTLMVDGKGQLAQDVNSGAWDPRPLYLNHLHPRVLKAESNPSFDHIVGDATPSYAGLEKWQRHLLFLKPSTLLVLDDIDAQQEHDYKLLFHCEAEPSEGKLSGQGLWLVKGRKASLLIQLLTPEQVQTTSGPFVFKDRHGEGATEKFCVTLQKHAARWRNATVFSWTDNLASSMARLDSGSNSWRFTLGTNVWIFDWKTTTLSQQ